MGELEYTDDVGETECTDLLERNTRGGKRCKTDKMVEVFASANDSEKNMGSL